MNFESWKEEFYSEDADIYSDYDADFTPRFTELDAAKHSLQKWAGLTEENLAKHNLVMHGLSMYNKDNVVEDDRDCIVLHPTGSTTCALCQYWSKVPDMCQKCILGRIGHQCGGIDSLYQLSISESFNPRPMIGILKSAVKVLEEELL